MITMVVGTDKKGVIGREDRIPWRLKADIINVRDKTKGRPVIIGRKTYDSMEWYYRGKQMPGSLYIIVTRNQSYIPTRPNTAVVHSITEAIERAKQEAADETPVMGGAAIYREMLPYVDRIYLTEVNTETEGDTYLPTLKPTEWRETSREHHSQDEKNEYDFDFVTLERIK